MDTDSKLIREIVREYDTGRPLVWFIECGGVLTSDDDPNALKSAPQTVLEPLVSLTELPRVLVAVGGTRSATELHQLTPFSKLAFAGYEGSELVIGERQLGHSGVPLARRMMEGIGTWIQAELSLVSDVRIVIQPLSVRVELLAPSDAAKVRATVGRIADRFRATTQVVESHDLIEVRWSQARRSGIVIETLLHECPHESPLVCCVARHAWMNEALAATQSHHGVTIGVEANSAEPIQYCLESSSAFAEFLTNLIAQLITVAGSAKWIDEVRRPTA